MPPPPSQVHPDGSHPGVCGMCASEVLTRLALHRRTPGQWIGSLIGGLLALWLVLGAMALVTWIFLRLLGVVH